MVGNPLPDISMTIPAKRGRGRPRKAELTARQGDEALGISLNESKQKKPRRKKGDLPPPVLDSSHIGQPVSGVLDGAFDAGYFVTVRIGETDAVLRGVLFGPGFSMPLTEAQKAPRPEPSGEEAGNVLGIHCNDTPDSSPPPYVAPESVPTRDPYMLPVSEGIDSFAIPIVTPTQMCAFTVAPVVKVELENSIGNTTMDFENSKGNAAMDFEISRGDETLYVETGEGSEGLDMEPARGNDRFDFETFTDQKAVKCKEET